MFKRSIRPDGFVEPCIPILAPKPPTSAGWVHEIKHDGYRLIVRRDGATVRLFTRRGYDWTERFPVIATAAAKLRAKSFTIDGNGCTMKRARKTWSSGTAWSARTARRRPTT
jgi:ATP-dependent DNA ligase